MDYEKLHKDTLAGLQRLVSEGKISEEVAKSICADFVAESEDERIIDFLIAYFSKGIWESSYPFSPLEIRNWLEKQKEQKSIQPYVEERLRGLIDKEGEYHRGAREELAHLLCVLGGHPSQYLINNVAKEEQQPAEWSEEDERICKGLKELIPQCMTAQGYNRYYNWLNNLHNRIHAQANWKPSEEQMDALNNSAYGTYQNGDGPALRELYEQLKKSYSYEIH